MDFFVTKDELYEKNFPLPALYYLSEKEYTYLNSKFEKGIVVCDSCKKVPTLMLDSYFTFKKDDEIQEILKMQCDCKYASTILDENRDIKSKAEEVVEKWRNGKAVFKEF